jgi:hypothetical protein
MQQVALTPQQLEVLSQLRSLPSVQQLHSSIIGQQSVASGGPARSGNTYLLANGQTLHHWSDFPQGPQELAHNSKNKVTDKYGVVREFSLSPDDVEANIVDFENHKFRAGGSSTR